MIAATGPSTTVVLVATILAFVGAAVAGMVTTRTARSGAALLDEAEVRGVGVPDPGSREERWARVAEVVLLVILGGYLFFDHAFAWIHVPGTPGFIGEIAIVIGVVAFLGMHMHLGTILKLSPSLRALAVFMVWGAILLVSAIPAWGLDAVRDAAVWYYGVIAMFVAVLVVADPDRVRSWLRLFGRAIPYLLLWFPVAIVLDAAFSDKVPFIPDSKIPIVAHRTGNLAVLTAIALAFLWLVDRDSELFDRRQRTTLTVLATVVILFAATRNRGGFVSGAIVLMIAFVMMRRERSNLVGIMVGVSILLLSFALFSNLRIELFAQREVSFEQFMDNFVSIFDRSAGGARQETTTQWRLDIWGRVLEDVSKDYPVAGFGPGPDLGKRYDISTDEDVPLRNPHNSHVGILARTGFVGVALWAFLWVTWFVEMIRLRRRLLVAARLREAAAVGWLAAAVAGVLVNAVFDPTLEGPQVAWWLWGFVGFGIAIAVLERIGRLPALSLGRSREAAPEPVVAVP